MYDWEFLFYCTCISKIKCTAGNFHFNVHVFLKLNAQLGIFISISFLFTEWKVRIVTDKKEMWDIIRKDHGGIKGSNKSKAMGSHFGCDKIIESMRLWVYFPVWRVKLLHMLWVARDVKGSRLDQNLKRDVKPSNQLMSQHRPGTNVALIWSLISQRPQKDIWQ